MRIKLLIVFFIYAFIDSASAHNKIGNGGGGIISQTGDFSLFSVIENEEKYSGRNTEIINCGSPIFVEIKKDIRKMQTFLPKNIGVFLMNNACQRGFNIHSHSLASPILFSSLEAKIQHFKNVYTMATGVDRKNIAIYAVTVSNYKKTYFLPDFYKLTYFKQKIILFHEIFWLYYFTQNSMNLELREEVLLYKKMLALEQATTQYLLNPDVIVNRAKFIKAIEEFKNFNSDTYTVFERFRNKRESHYED